MIDATHTRGQGSGGPAAAAAAGGLDNNAKFCRHFSAENRSERASDQRLDRWEARDFLWTYSSLHRCRKCGRVSVTGDGSVGVRKEGEKVGYAGLATCGSIWACPVCNSKIQARRRLEVEVAIAAAFLLGFGVAFVTRTVRHNRGQSLDSVLAMLTKGRAAIPRHREVASLRKSLGYIGQIRALEVMLDGPNGPHPHDHSLYFFERPISAADLARLHAAEMRAFTRRIERMGGAAPTMSGQDARIVEAPDGVLADYFTKSTFGASKVGFEMTSTQTKRGRAGGRTPWEVLRLARDGDADALDTFNGYERTMKGKRAMYWSPGLRDRLGLGVEQSDEQIAEETVGSVEDEGFRLASVPWGRGTGWAGAALLNSLSAGGWSAARAFCREHGIEILENAA